MTSPEIKFWYFPGSCALASHILLADSGLQYEANSVDIRDPAIRAEYVKTVNPKGQVPALSIDGEIITEAPAIVTAISQLVPAKKYTGGTPLETVRFYEWINYLSGTIHSKSFSAVFRPSVLTADESAEDSVRAKAKENALAGFELIEQKLASQGSPAHAIGGTLSGVDVYLVVFHRWAEMFQWDLSPFPKFTKLVKGVTGSPSFEKIAALHQRKA